jgi:hypothetical protein
MIKRRSLMKLILLSLITCGIYGIFFWWGYINDINDVCVCDGKKSPNYLIVTILTFLTCGIYYLFWLYNQGERLKIIAPDYGLEFKQGGGSVVWMYLAGSFVLNLGSALSGAVYGLSGLGKSAVITIGNQVVDPSVITARLSLLGITPDVLWMLAFFCFVLYIVSVSLMLNAHNVLIKNLNEVGKVYNIRCV